MAYSKEELHAKHNLHIPFNHKDKNKIGYVIFKFSMGDFKLKYLRARRPFSVNHCNPHFVGIFIKVANMTSCKLKVKEKKKKRM